jgi:hypothetical protein
LQMLYENSVGPRKGEIAAALQRRSRILERHSAQDPLDVVVDLSPLDETIRRLKGLARHRHEIASSAPEQKRWESRVVRLLLEWHSSGENPDHLTAKASELVRARPDPRFDAPGMIDYDVVEELTETVGWESVSPLAEGDVAIRTTLGQVDAAAARRLIARGYLNTWVTTLLFKVREAREHDVLNDLSKRLDTIAS